MIPLLPLNSIIIVTKGRQFSPHFQFVKQVISSCLRTSISNSFFTNICDKEFFIIMFSLFYLLKHFISIFYLVRIQEKTYNVVECQKKVCFSYKTKHSTCVSKMGIRKFISCADDIRHKKVKTVLYYNEAYKKLMKKKKACILN